MLRPRPADYRRTMGSMRGSIALAAAVATIAWTALTLAAPSHAAKGGGAEHAAQARSGPAKLFCLLPGR
jgi:hypothetical protein